ncbi:hypothetical protein [Pseudoneobacillus sp. C159]
MKKLILTVFVIGAFTLGVMGSVAYNPTVLTAEETNGGFPIQPPV